MSKNLEIVMIGNRGVGKTSTLAAMWYSLDKLGVNNTDLSLEPMGETFKELRERWQGVLEKITKNAPFVTVDPGMPGTAGYIEHKFVFKAGSKKQNVIFTDSAGGFTHDLDSKLIAKANNAIGLFFVVDASILMECDAATNERWNDPMTLRQIIQTITNDGDKKQPRFLMFILTKCEKYMSDEASRQRLFAKFNAIYGHVALYIKSQNIATYYLPIQTIGCITYSRLSDEGLPIFKKVYKEFAPVDVTYPLKVAFEHIIDQMSTSPFYKFLVLLHLSEDIKKYKDNLDNLVPKPLDFRKL